MASLKIAEVSLCSVPSTSESLSSLIIRKLLRQRTRIGRSSFCNDNWNTIKREETTKKVQGIQSTAYFEVTRPESPLPLCYDYRFFNEMASKLPDNNCHSRILSPIQPSVNRSIINICYQSTIDADIHFYIIGVSGESIVLPSTFYPQNRLT